MSPLASRAATQTAGFLILFSLIFVSAGTIHFWQGWLFCVSFFFSTIATGVYLMRRDPALLERRMQFGPRAESRPRQKIIVAVIFAMFAALLIVPGMDHRFGWSQVPAAIVVLANLLIIADLRSLPRGVARKYVRSLNDHRRGGTACNLHRAIRARAPSDVRGRRPAHFRNACRAEFLLSDAARGARNPGFDSAHPRRRAHALGQAARLRRLLPHRHLSIEFHSCGNAAANGRAAHDFGNPRSAASGAPKVPTLL